MTSNKRVSLGIMQGLPLSGKSTYLRKMKEDGCDFVVVCPDTIRLAITNEQFNGFAEPFVWATAQAMVRTLLLEGYSVIVDATNTTKERRKMWKYIAKELNVEFTIYYLSPEVEICKARNNELGRLPESVIDRMNDNWEEPTEDEGVIVQI